MTTRRLVARVTTVSCYALRVVACLLAALLAYSVAFLIVESASFVPIHQDDPNRGGVMIQTPVWGLPFQLLVAAGAAALAWRVTTWVKPGAFRMHCQAPDSLPPATHREARRQASVGGWLVAAGIVAPLAALPLWSGCDDECHGYAFVLIPSAFVAYSGGLLRAAGITLSRGTAIPPFLTLLACVNIVVSGLLGIGAVAGTVAAWIEGTEALGLTVFFVVLAAAPGGAGLRASLGVRSLRRVSPPPPESLRQRYGLAHLDLPTSELLVYAGLAIATAVFTKVTIDLPLLLGVPFWLLVVWAALWSLDPQRGRAR